MFTGDEEEIMPWYLSRKQKNKKSSALATTPRNPYQKKDNKINDALRKSDKIELEWLEKYSMIKYNYFIAPKIEDKYNNKKKNNWQGNEKKRR